MKTVNLLSATEMIAPLELDGSYRVLGIEGHEDKVAILRPNDTAFDLMCLALAWTDVAHSRLRIDDEERTLEFVV